jgi:hypothetical protein
MREDEENTTPMNRRLCWNCKEWSVTQEDGACEGCGVPNPYHEEEVTRVKAELEKLQRLSRWEYDRMKNNVNWQGYMVLFFWLGIGFVGGRYGWDKGGLIGLILGVILGLGFGLFASAYLVNRVSDFLEERRWKKHEQRISQLKERLQTLIQPILPHPRREEKQRLQANIEEIRAGIWGLKERYAAFSPADRTKKYIEHKSEIVERETEIEKHHFLIWCNDFAFWTNQYVSFPTQRDDLSHQDCGQRITELTSLHSRGKQLLHGWRGEWNSFDTESCFNALTKSLDFCQREIDELKVQQEAILIADATEKYKPLIADPYYIEAPECDRRAVALEQAIRWGRAQLSRYNNASLTSLTGMERLVDELSKMLQEYQAAIDVLKRVAYEIELSQKGTRLPGDILKMLSARQAEMLQNVNARKEAIRELASPAATEAQLERIRQQRIEFQSRQELDRFVNSIAVIKTPTEETAKQSQGNALS